jgi:hypothetical protein
MSLTHTGMARIWEVLSFGSITTPMKYFWSDLLSY